LGGEVGMDGPHPTSAGEVLEARVLLTPYGSKRDLLPTTIQPLTVMPMRRVTILLAVWTAWVWTAVPPAQAGRLEVADPSGDTYNGSSLLDITTVVVRNLDRSIVTKVFFARAGKGDLIVHFQTNGEPERVLAAVVSHHRPRRGDRNSFAATDGTEGCNGLRVSWNHDLDLAAIKVPSRCLAQGAYDDVRARVLTEIVVDQDVYAPNPGARGWPWTRWVARG
jgi:hypothetical protein